MADERSHEWRVMSKEIVIPATDGDEVLQLPDAVAHHAHLIAAAPKMHKALARLLALVDVPIGAQPSSTDSMGDAVAEARKALKAADPYGIQTMGQSLGQSRGVPGA